MPPTCGQQLAESVLNVGLATPDPSQRWNEESRQHLSFERAEGFRIRSTPEPHLRVTATRSANVCSWSIRLSWMGELSSARAVGTGAEETISTSSGRGGYSEQFDDLVVLRRDRPKSRRPSGERFEELSPNLRFESIDLHRSRSLMAAEAPGTERRTDPCPRPFDLTEPRRLWHTSIAGER
jgi:hypothetical protein